MAGFDDDEDQDIRGKYKRACATLGVTLPKTPPKTPRAEQEQVLTRWKDGVLKKAWQAAAKQWHPDTPTGNADKFKSAKEAYDLLAGLQLRPERPPEPPPEVDLDFADVRPHRAPPAEPGAAWAPRVSRGSDGGMVIDVGFVSFDVSAAQMQALAEARKMAEQMLEARLEQERQALKNRVQREATDKLMDLLGPILFDGVPLADTMARKPKRKKPAKKPGTRTTVIG